MGAKDSKPSFISYEDAVKRVSDNELRRIREAFKRCAGTNGTSLSLEVFVREVLCDGVPYEVADWLYQACGGTKRGIGFKDLLCGIVVLTKGNLEEKIKFLWTLYVNNQNDNGTYINKWDFARTLHLENTSLPSTNAPKAAEILTSLFGFGDRVTFDQFRSWLLIHKDATVLSKWLLSDINNVAHDLETPTFYQSLAGVTHLEERDIIELEKCFWSLRNNAATGELDADSLAPLLSPPLPLPAVAGVFGALDDNRDGHVDFKELCCGLSAACRGPRTERLKFCFKIFDVDRDGVLNKKELVDMVGILSTIANEALKNQSSRASTPSDSNDSDGTEKGFDPEVLLLNLRDKLTNQPKNGRIPLFQLGSINDSENIVDLKTETEEQAEGDDERVLSLQEFLIWSVESAESLVSPWLELMFDVSHVVLGLRPQCPHHERDIVLGWLRREVQRGYSVGQFWYLVSMEWWTSWLAYTAAGSTDHCCRLQPLQRQVDEAVVCDESFTTNSTESMGSLLWRAESASLGSASSSGVSSTPPRPAPRRPPVIDNSRLLATDTLKTRTLTGEGGVLRRDVMLAQHRDFELLPDGLWRALAAWYGATTPLPRQVIRPPNSDVELELYPLHLKIYRHVPNTQKTAVTSCAGASGGVLGVGVGAGVYAAVPGVPERQLAYTAAFSRLATVRQVNEFICQALGLTREDVRLWSLGGEGGGGTQVLLDDETPTLQELRFDERTRLLLEVRNSDLTWPEEIGALSMNSGSGRAVERRETLTAPIMAGATGLHNLGNTCFMNAALQAVWNTSALTQYFNSGMHLYEVNTINPLGTKGVLALRFGELCKEVWSMSATSVAPLRVRWCVSRWARALAGGGQHDAQELLAWLLDALHEDLNRAATDPPTYNNNKTTTATTADTADQPRPDQVVAAEAWEQYSQRNNSIMTDLFYGQLKSKVRCDTCGRESVTFDTFNMLSLPLPMESYVRCEIRVMLLDGSVPIKYGVRVNSEGTYLDVKKRLNVLCGLPVESMLLVELSGATVGRVLEDGARLRASGSNGCGTGGVRELCAYQLPDEGVDEYSDEELLPHAHRGCSEDWSQWAEVSGASNPSSLCMPALFCFKRSRSELLAQSPPNIFGVSKVNTPFTDVPGDYRSSTLPKYAAELKKMAQVNGSPTLSVKSLNLRPSSPKLGKVKFASSPSNMYKMNEMNDTTPPIGKIQYLVAVHRKQVMSDASFVWWQRSRAALFGVPVVVGVHDGLSGRELYARVWTQLARLLSARAHTRQPNHATDCDDSLGYEFPFTLRVVSGASGAAWCGVCAWTAMCRGCALPSTDTPLITGCSPSSGAGSRRRTRVRHGSLEPVPSTGAADVPDGCSPAARAKLGRQHSARRDTDATQCSQMDGCGELRKLDFNELRMRRRGLGDLMLAVDWDPTALHLRYQTTREKAWQEHPSMAECSALSAQPIDLASCLRAFTGEERLEEPYHCSACRSAQPATKKLQIWRLPPVLIIHLKRFQYVNNKWIKSQKVVNFPFQDFDPTPYLASVPQETILRHMELKNIYKRRSSMFVDLQGHISESESEHSEEEREETQNIAETRSPPKLKLKIDHNRTEQQGTTRERLESTSLVTTPVLDDNLVDYHQHLLKPEQDTFDLKYRLYAVVSHSGQLSGGHYVAYARNPGGPWLCYNDSMCRELRGSAPPIDAAAAYLLFYERRGVAPEKYLPRTDRPPPQVTLATTERPTDADLHKLCTIA